MPETPDSLSRITGPVAFIGGGNMARSLIGALIGKGAKADSIVVAEPNDATRSALQRDFGVSVRAHARDAAQGAATLFFAVKPQVLKAVCEGLANTVAERKPLVISIAAGIRIAQIRHWLGSDLPIVRAMPNTPALLGAGATGLIANALVDDTQRAQAQAVLANAGSTVWIEHEDLMDTVTALSGSGPAYFFAFVEALEDAAVAQGLPRDSARALATQTCLGAGRMLVESREAPALLRERVTSPGGTTAAALDVFASGDLGGLASRAVAAATQRGRELSEHYS